MSAVQLHRGFNAPRAPSLDGDAGSSTRQRSRRGEGDKLREEILDAAEDLLVELHTADAVSMRAIAERVGVSPPSIYLHFADKEELFWECCTRRLLELTADMLAAADGHTSSSERLAAVAQSYISGGVARGAHYQVIFAGEPPASLGEDALIPGHAAIEFATALIADGMAQGEFRDDLDPKVAAFSCWAVAHGAVLALLQSLREPGYGLPATDEVIDATIDVLLRGLRP